MSSREEDAGRAAIAVGFFLLGAWCVVAAVAEGQDVPLPLRVVLALSGPTLAALAGVHAYLAARKEGGR
ncbi:hypothetical protein [Actinomadura sp. 21ATH]|uniref:hypothetical protein n=1 Tax=Actinomadura sp. 21ATH TaxID=1735444 RepID=UPI0035C16FBD